ncbi:macrophage mannose receptor 1 isoform X2 [Ixodes scapularis]|uniref:macrophage mannose receptor 1 isoform X2 n=1 Tax=Ixodes scapularis TaxID=6945 RepID=UPI001A9D53DA|nr:macrophage mannose receptor 1 isoform X2 [Ixodes scapularis]
MWFLFAGFLLMAGTSATQLKRNLGNCDEGWVAFGSKCYFFASNTSRLRFYDARQHCIRQNAQLVTIPSVQVQQFLLSHLGDASTNVWIGLKTITGGSKWLDGSPIAYKNWFWGQPKLGMGLHCVEILTGRVHPGRWNQAPCDKFRLHVCEKARDPTVPIPKPVEDPSCRLAHPGSFPYGTSCFHMGSYEDWDTAEAHCASSGGHLASVRDIYQESFFSVRFEFRGGLVWIGLQDAKGSGRFTWSDGWPVHHTNWAPLQPGAAERGERRCVAQDMATGQWSVQPCKTSLPYLCKITSEKPPAVEHHEGVCPETAKGWVDVGNPYCYFFSGSRVENFLGAVEACDERNSTLVSFHSQDQLDRLLPYIRLSPSNLWIGLEENKNGTFEWLDGSPLDFEYWQKGEPNGKDENCVELRHFDSLWNDIKCSVRNAFICAAAKVFPDGHQQGSGQSSPLTGSVSPALGVSLGLLSLLLIVVAAIVARVYFRQRRPGPSVFFENAVYMEERQPQSTTETSPSPFPGA